MVGVIFDFGGHDIGQAGRKEIAKLVSPYKAPNGENVSGVADLAYRADRGNKSESGGSSGARVNQADRTVQNIYLNGKNG